MTTFIDFVPSTVQSPSFQVALDGDTYTATIIWNLFAQRYYLQIESLGGDLIIYEALVGSPIGLNISAASWANGKSTITTVFNHGFTIGQVVDITVIGIVPVAYNGMVKVLITGKNTLTYPIPANPGAATVLGSIQQNINLVAGLFASTMVYRAANRQFEITP